MPTSLVNTIWDAQLPANGGVRTIWDPPAATTNPAAGLYTGPSTGYGYGSDPFVAPSSASGLAGNAAQSNLTSAADITRLTDLVNAINRANQQAANQSRLGPQGQQIQANLMNEAERMSAGLVPNSTEDMLRQNIAQMGIGGGFGPDSSVLSSAYNRALGIDQNANIAQGLNTYGALTALNPSAPIVSAQDYTVSPALYSQTAAQQAQRQLEQQQLDQQYRMFMQELALRYPSGSSTSTTYRMGVPPNPFGVFTGSSGTSTPTAGGSSGYGYNPFGVVSGAAASGGGSSGPSYEDYIAEMDPTGEYDWWGNTPDNTVYNSLTDTLDYNYGLPSWMGE